MNTVTFRFPQPLYVALVGHLFPGDNDEHGAVIAAGICESERGTRLLARRLFLARDGVDYVPGKHGYRALTADFVARVSNQCARQNLCYFAVHCHGGDDSVGFSSADLRSHKRGYPALLDITNGGPVGALVFARNAVAGRVWTRNDVLPLDNTVVVGPNIQRLHSAPESDVRAFDPIYHRQSLIFGSAGQHLLRKTKVGIIGLGGAGSLLNEWLAKLGIGEIVAVDYDRLDPTNQPRIPGATRWDAQAFLLTRQWSPFQRLGQWLAKYKVHVARRVALRANPRIHYRAIVGNVTFRDVALLLKDVDYLFLCADSAQCRLVFNALVHQYLLPGVQVGSKVPIDGQTGFIVEPFTVTRPVMPFPEGGCLLCNELISAAQLQEEALSEAERKRQAYVEDPLVVAPSLITLNAVACAPAANDFLFGYFALLNKHVKRGYLMNFCRDRRWSHVDSRADDTCLHCGTAIGSIFARGDRAELPCRTR